MTWIQKYTPILLLLTGGLILTAGDLVMKRWVIRNDWQTFAVGMTVYMAAMIFLSYSFRYRNMAVASAIFVGFNVATLLVVSWALYGERVTSAQAIGLLLTMAGIIILEIEQ